MGGCESSVPCAVCGGCRSNCTCAGPQVPASGASDLEAVEARRLEFALHEISLVSKAVAQDRDRLLDRLYEVPFGALKTQLLGTQASSLVSVHQSILMKIEKSLNMHMQALTVALGTVQKEKLVSRGVSSALMTAVFDAACAWRDSARTPDALVGELEDVHEQALIAAIDTARKGHLP